MCRERLGHLANCRRCHGSPQVLWHTVVEEAYGNEKGMLGGLRIKDVQSGEGRDLPVNGLFFAIGHEPASAFLAGQVSRLPKQAVVHRRLGAAQRPCGCHAPAY